MTSKRELEQKVTDLKFELEQSKENGKLLHEMWTQLIDENNKLKEKLQTKQIAFITADVSNYPIDAQAELLEKVREGIDAEFERLSIDTDVVIMPSIVKNIKFHEMKKVKE